MYRLRFLHFLFRPNGWHHYGCKEIFDRLCGWQPRYCRKKFPFHSYFVRFYRISQPGKVGCSASISANLFPVRGLYNRHLNRKLIEEVHPAEKGSTVRKIIPSIVIKYIYKYDRAESIQRTSFSLNVHHTWHGTLCGCNNKDDIHIFKYIWMNGCAVHGNRNLIAIARLKCSSTHQMCTKIVWMQMICSSLSFCARIECDECSSQCACVTSVCVQRDILHIQISNRNPTTTTHVTQH